MGLWRATSDPSGGMDFNNARAGDVHVEICGRTLRLEHFFVCVQQLKSNVQASI